MMALLENYDLKAMGHNSVDYIHTLSEAIKLAFADRERFYGDPRYIDVPLETLLSKDYNRERKAMIRRDEAWPEMPPHGAVAGFEAMAAKLLSAAARRRNISATTPPMPARSTPRATPSRPRRRIAAAPRRSSRALGLVASSRGSQNWAVEGHASAIAPGKRPRLTPNPALAMIDGKMTMPFGTPGGDVQCQAMLQVFLNIHQFGMDPQTAIEAPRFATYSAPSSFEPHEADPGVLKIENRIDKATGDSARRQGPQGRPGGPRSPARPARSAPSSTTARPSASPAAPTRAACPAPWGGER